MIINSTQKAKSIFSKLPAVTDKVEGKRIAEANPFFSWHANYYTINRKKILIVINDLTWAPVVVGPVMAAERDQVPAMIQDAITESFANVGISEFEIKRYFKLAGDFQTGAGFNRSLTGYLTNVILMIEGEPLSEVMYNRPMMNTFLTDTAASHINSVPYVEIKRAFKNSMVVNAVPAAEPTSAIDPHAHKAAYLVERTWPSLHDVKAVIITDERGDYEDFEVFEETSVERWKLISVAFRRYLEEALDLSAKTARKHVNNIEIYDGYCLYQQMHTVVSDYEDVTGFFIGYEPLSRDFSKAEISSIAGSMKKFFQFMVLAGEVSEADFKEIKKAITEGAAALKEQGHSYW